MHPEILRMAANERQADLLRTAAAARRAREARATELPAPRVGRDDTHVTLRLDRVWDSARLHELAAAAGRRVTDGPYVVTEVGGRIVAALPVDGGAPLADTAARTAHLLPLLELRAAQIRRVDLRPRRRLRLLPRRI